MTMSHCSLTVPTVRLKRPNAVQTRGQIACVKEFETFILPQCLLFSSKPPGDRDKKLGRFNLDTCLKRQKFIVHGYEARALKHIPKLLYVIYERLLRLCDARNVGYNVNVSNFTRQFLVYQMSLNRPADQQSRLFGPQDSLVESNGGVAAHGGGPPLLTRRSSQSLVSSSEDGQSEVNTTTTTPGIGKRNRDALQENLLKCIKMYLKVFLCLNMLYTLYSNTEV